MTRGIAEAAGARDTPSLCVTDFSCQDCVTPPEISATRLRRRCHVSPHMRPASSDTDMIVRGQGNAEGDKECELAQHY